MTESQQGFIERHYFLLRRLHSLSGIFPIGFFLLPHLTTNSSIMWGSWLNEANHGHAGVETFQHEVEFIHDLPALILIEWGFLFLPLIFHAALGVYFASTGKINVERYPYQKNWRYTIQRATGYIGVIFIVMHILSLRFQISFGGLMPEFELNAASSSTAQHFQNGAWGSFASIFYMVCVLSLVFHFANGLWTAGITWGLTITEHAQKRWGQICAALGIGLSTAAVMAILGFSMLDIPEAQQVEQEILAGANASQLVISEQDGAN